MATHTEDNSVNIEQSKCDKKFFCAHCAEVGRSADFITPEGVSSHTKRAHRNCHVPCHECGNLFENDISLQQHFNEWHSKYVIS